MNNLNNEKKLLKELIKAAQKQPESEGTEQENTNENKASQAASNDALRFKTVEEIIKEYETANPKNKE